VNSKHIVALLALGGTSLIAGSAEGFIQIGSIRKELKFAKAARVADRFDPSKQVLHLVLSDAPVPSKALFNGMRLFAITSTSDVQVVEFDFSENGVKWFFSAKGMPGTRSMNQSPNPFPYEMKGSVMHGKIQSKSEALAEDQPGIEISVTYSAEIEKAVVEAAPTAVETAAAQHSPAAKAYLDRMDAIQKGDKARLMAASTPEMRAQLAAADFKQILPMIQGMQPKNLKILKAVDTATESTLSLSGIVEGKLQKGEVEMHLVDGHWLVKLEIWDD
jgi:hypothetical protein